MTKYKMLFEPIRIGKVLVNNRIAMAPMAVGGLVNPDGTLTQRAIDYYVERAKGGVGLLIAAVAKVENEIERVLIDGAVPRILITRRATSSLGELAESAHNYGSKIFIQLTAGYGRVLSGNAIDCGINPVSASAIPAYYRPRITARPLSTDEVEKLVKAFGQAAEIVAAAGMDGIELHGHQGYLFDQFTTAIWNRRNDKYGGELKDRLRFSIEVIEAIRDQAGKDFPIIYRFGLKHFMKDLLSPSLKPGGFVEAGRDVPEGLEIARQLEKAGVNALHVDGGCHESLYWVHPPTYQPHGCLVELAAEAKKAVSIPVIAVGRLEIPELAEKVLEEGKADIIALGRGLLTDPYWPRKVLEGRIDDIRPCIGCHDACIDRITIGLRTKPLCCTVNPSTGRERLYAATQTEKPKKILIAGGGVAGMEVARVATMRGHRVTLYEKNEFLGGHLIEASVPDFKKDIGRLLEWYKRQLEKSETNVVLDTKATPELVESEKPDVVVVATGSTCIRPRIKGIERPNAATCVDFLLGAKKAAGDTVAVVGGGLVGCETALWFAEQGKSVKIVEMLPDLMMAGLPVFRANRMMLLDLLALNKVEIMTNTSIHEITEKGVIVIDNKFRTREIECDTVALGLGLKSEDQLFNSLRGKVSHLYSIGDCKEPRRILEAIWDGYSVGCAL